MAILARKLWSIDEYELMIEKGVLNENTRVELIHGEIVEMAPIGLRHGACVTALEELFHEALGRSVTISVQNPVQLYDESEPEPDLALLKRRTDAYATKRPTAEDVLLVVEVADTTLATDRTVKVPLYADAGIPEVWLVNVDELTMEVYSGSAAGKYSSTTTARLGSSLRLPGGLTGAIAVSAVLGHRNIVA